MERKKRIRGSVEKRKATPKFNAKLLEGQLAGKDKWETESIRKEFDELMEKFGGINGKSRFDITPLFKAVEKGDIELVKILLEQGAEDTIDGFRQNTVKKAASISEVSEEKRMKIVRLLAGAGFEVDVPNYEGRTALMTIARFTNGHETVKLLIEKGADVNRRCKEYGRTALFGAIEFGNKETVEALLRAGADVSVVDKYEMSPVMLARKKQYRYHEIAARYGIRYGMDDPIMFARKKQRTHYEIAVLKRRYDEIAGLLVTYGDKK